MILSTPLLSIIKYSFLGLVVAGAGFLIANTAVTMRYKSEKMEHLAYKAQPFPRSLSLSLHRNSLLCLTHPSKPFCLMTSKKRLELLRNRHGSSNLADNSSGEVTSTVSTRLHHPHYLLMKDFVDFANSLKVTPILLEPSILFCMLSTLQKYSVISNNLQTKILQGSPNTVTFGIFERDSRILTLESSINISSSLGFEFSRSRKDFHQNGEFADTSFSFSRRNLTVTLVVFFQRETFMWHPGSLKNRSTHQSLQFASDQAYENFTAVPFLLENGQPSGFYLPSEVPHFLLQVQRSEIEECLPTSEDTPASHPTLTLDQLNQRALIAIQEMKSVLRPLLGIFWLWNETLSGWNENCNIFQKTTELHIAVAVPVSVVPKMNFNSTFVGNEYLHQVEYHGWDDFQLQSLLDCYGLRIRITVIYEDHDSMWNYDKDSAGNVTKNYYTKLRLCSTSVLGQLVHKPCSKQIST